MADSLSSPSAAQSAFISARRDFVDLWGQMAEHWGINRTMAQIHALLMICHAPITAEQIMEELRISRGNVSMNLRDLINWGLVRRTSVAGDRRDFFITEAEIWTMFHVILRERKKRELDPVLSRLDECLELAGKKPPSAEEKLAHDAYVHRLNELRDVFHSIHRVFTAMLGKDPASLAKMIKTLDKML